jgi:putative transposase
MQGMTRREMFTVTVLSGRFYMEWVLTIQCMERRELRHDRHTVSLLTDHMVFSPKYRGKILVGDVALALDGIIRKTCKDLNIEIIDMAVNVDHVHLFVKYPPKYSVSYIAKRIKGRSSRELRKAFPHLTEWCILHTATT